MSRRRKWLLGISLGVMVLAVILYFRTVSAREADHNAERLKLDRYCKSIKYGMSKDEVESIVGRKVDSVWIGFWRSTQSDVAMAWGGSFAGPMNALPWAMPAIRQETWIWFFIDEAIVVEVGRCGEVIRAERRPMRPNGLFKSIASANSSALIRLS